MSKLKNTLKVGVLDMARDKTQMNQALDRGIKFSKLGTLREEKITQDSSCRTTYELSQAIHIS